MKLGEKVDYMVPLLQALYTKKVPKIWADEYSVSVLRRPRDAFANFMEKLAYHDNLEETILWVSPHCFFSNIRAEDCSWLPNAIAIKLYDVSIRRDSFRADLFTMGIFAVTSEQSKDDLYYEISQVLDALLVYLATVDSLVEHSDMKVKIVGSSHPYTHPTLWPPQLTLSTTALDSIQRVHFDDVLLNEALVKKSATRC
jgi:hypothetical protein